MKKTDLIEYVNNLYRNGTILNCKKLYSCKAEVYSMNEGLILKSYNTLVAYYDFKTKALYKFDYFSSTTCQHMAKFEKWINKNQNLPVQKVVNLWLSKSFYNASEIKELSNNDFESLINL